MSKGSLDTDNFNNAADIHVYAKTNEVFVADGYVNRRVIVLDADTGAFKRMWGAYGNAPDDAAPNQPSDEGPGAQQFNLVHGVRVSDDGLVYVADRRNNRMQVFTIDGKFQRELFVERKTKLLGTSFSVAFSPDPRQEYLYLADAGNGRVHIYDRQNARGSRRLRTDRPLRRRVRLSPCRRGGLEGQRLHGRGRRRPPGSEVRAVSDRDKISLFLAVLRCRRLGGLMKRFTMAATMLAAALSVTISAQKITPLKTGSGGSAHVRTECDGRRREHLDRVRPADAEGPDAGQGHRPVRGQGMADRRRRADHAQDGQAAEDRHAHGPGRHLRPPHDPGQRHVAAHRQQARERAGASRIPRARISAACR